jgi:hypothetical protein
MLPRADAAIKAWPFCKKAPTEELRVAGVSGKKTAEGVTLSKPDFFLFFCSSQINTPTGPVGSSLCCM